MTYLISFGILMAFGLVIFVTIKWWNLRLIGPDPVPLLVFMAILFTSGLDVGLIMFPLAFDYPLYADTEANPAYAFTNPLALEFGFWGFLIWAFYFLTAFYFCAIEPRVKFFEKPLVKLVNNVVIITTCAFTGSLFLIYLPYYLPCIGDGETVVATFYVVVFAVILAASYSSTDIKYVKVLSIGSTVLFLALILGMWVYAGCRSSNSARRSANIGGYFGNIQRFVLPLTEYHEFYLFWWFAWSVMIGQFTSRFVGGMKTQHMLAALLDHTLDPARRVVFGALLLLSEQHLDRWSGKLGDGLVGTTFVINSLDS